MPLGASAGCSSPVFDETRASSDKPPGASGFFLTIEAHLERALGPDSVNSAFSGRFTGQQLLLPERPVVRFHRHRLSAAEQAGADQAQHGKRFPEAVR